MAILRLSSATKSVLGSALVAVGASVLVGFFIQINLRLAMSFPWFTVPAAVVAVCTLNWTARFAPQRSNGLLPNPARAILMSVVAAVVLVLAALALMNHDAWRQGRLLLPGDSDPAPILFQNAHSLLSLACGGMIEEGAVRNMVQLRLQHEMRPLLAEALAGGLFILLHAVRWATPAELPFITLVALVNGRLAAVTQNARYPALTHSLANIGIGVTILSFRH